MSEPEQSPSLSVGCGVAAALALSALLSLPALASLVRRPSLEALCALAISLGVFLIPTLLLRRPVWLSLGGVAVMLLNAPDLVHVILYGKPFGLGGLQAALYADRLEAAEFVCENLFPIGAALASLGGFVWLAWVRARSGAVPLRWAAAAASLLVLPASLTLYATAQAREGAIAAPFLPTRLLEHQAGLVGLDPALHTLSGLIETHLARQRAEALNASRLAVRYCPSRAGPLPRRELYLLVIGEASRRCSWQLYGYPRPTTPRLAARRDLLVFRDALAPASVTAASLLQSLTPADPSDYQRYLRSPSLVALFAEGGFHTLWLTTQGVGSPVDALAREADEFHVVARGLWEVGADERLLPLVEQALARRRPRQLIVLQTLGSHANYGARVPPGFQADLSSTSAAGAHARDDLSHGEIERIELYDQTIAYTDRLLDRLIQAHAATGAEGAVLYFSDQGERLYEDAARRRGHGFASPNRLELEVPLLLWLSPAYRAAHPDRVAAVQRNLTLPVTTADLFHALPGLAGFRAEVLDPSRDFCGARFVPRPRQYLDMEQQPLGEEQAPDPRATPARSGR